MGVVVTVTAARKAAEQRLGVVREAAVVRRRRPGLWIAGACLVMVSALMAARLVGSAGDRVPVLAVARVVHIGQTLSANDLIVARIAADPSLRPVLADNRDQVMGKAAAVELRPGNLLTADAVTGSAVPGPGQQLVGVAVKAGQWPARGLVAGDRVLVVLVPVQQAASGAAVDTADASSAVEPLRALVWDVGAADVEGATTVDLVVDAAAGPRLAAWGSAGRVALLLLPAGR